MHSQLRRRSWRHRLNKIKSQLGDILKVKDAGKTAKKDPPSDNKGGSSK